MHNFQIKKVFKSNKKSQRFRDFKHRQNITYSFSIHSIHTFKRTAYDKFDYKLFLLSQLTRELALYEMKQGHNGMKQILMENLILVNQSFQKVLYKMAQKYHIILVQKTQNLMQSSLLISSKKMNLLGMQRSGQLSYHLFGGVRVDIQNSMKIPISQFIKVCVKTIQKQSQLDFFSGNNCLQEAINW